MNLFQINTQANKWVVNNAGYDLGNYRDFIQKSIELLKRETFKVNVIKRIEEIKDQNGKLIATEIRYYLPENSDKKQQKIDALLLDEKTEIVFDQNKNFYRGDEIEIIDQNPDGNYIILAKEAQGTILYLKPNTYQLEQQLKAIDALRNRPQATHRALLQLFGAPDDNFWKGRSERTTVTDWHILTDATRDGSMEQREFVEKALNSPDFSLLEGPPGSGKTTTIIELIIQFAMQGKRVLLCSATHAAIDNVIERVTGKYKTACENYIVPVRIAAAENQIKECVRPYILKNVVNEYKKGIKSFLQQNNELGSQQFLKENIDKEDRYIDRIILDSANLVGGTMVGILQHPDLRKGAQTAEFDVLIVDESSKVTFQEFLIPALHAKRWILVGDVKQLSPYTEDDYVAENLRHLINQDEQDILVRQYELKRCMDDEKFDDCAIVYFAVKNIAQELFFIQAMNRDVVIQIIDNHFTINDENIALLNAADILICADTQKAKDLLAKYLVVKSVFVNGILNKTALLKQDYFHKNTYKKSAFNATYQYEFESKDEVWADTVASKLSQRFSFRNAGSEFQNIDKELAYLLPTAPKEREEIEKIERLAFPSILELLQNGVGKTEGQKKDRVLSNGFSDAAKRSRFSALEYQHRMHPDIAATSRRNFYAELDNLKPANTVTDDNFRASEWKYAPHEPAVIWVSNNDNTFQQEQRKIVNPTEVRDMEAQLRKFMDWAAKNPKIDKYGKIEKYEVAVLSFYLDQDRELRKMVRRITNNHKAFSQFRTQYVDIFLYTVDKFQGQEADLVLLGFTKTGPNAHFNSPNRLNVALTRARYKLILFGNVEWFKKRAKLNALRDLATNFKSILSTNQFTKK